MSPLVRRIVCLLFAVLCSKTIVHAQEAVRVILSRALTYNVFSRALPIKFTTSYGDGYVVDLMFCGQGSGVSSKVLMIAGSSVPNFPQPASPTSNLTSPYPRLLMSHCDQSLTDVAHYLSGSYYAGDAIVLGSVTWENWALNFRVVTVEGIDSSVAETAKFASELTKDKVLAHFDTRNLTTKLANGSTITFDSQMAFFADTFRLALIPAPASAELPTSYLIDGQMSGYENFDLRLPVSVFNQISAKQIGKAAFPLNRAVFGGFEIAEPSLAIAAGTLQTKAAAVCPNCTPIDFVITWTGDDLAVDNVTMTLRQQCSGPHDLICNFFVRTLPGVASSITNNIRGQLLRPTDFEQGTDITAFKMPLHLKIEGLKSSLSGQEIRFQNVMSIARDHDN